MSVFAGVARLVMPSLALAISLAAAAPAAANGRYGCACLTNETGVKINFRYKFGDKPFSKAAMSPNARQWICYDYGNGPRTSPPLKFELDVDMSKGNAWTVYALERFQSAAKSCNAIPKGAQYGVRYRGGTNKQFIEVYKR